MTAYAYLRKSRIDLAKSVAPETQERLCRELAARHGDENIVLLSDWDISGSRKATKKRAGYLELREALSRGEVTAIYSYSLSRLARSVQELSSLFDACRDRKVPIRLVVDSVDTSTASGTMLANILASVAQFESEVASERMTAMYQTKRLKGVRVANTKRFGEATGQDESIVRKAVQEQGSYSAAARWLNENNVPARNGKPWWASAVRVIYLRLEPNTDPKPGRGRRLRSGFPLSKLLICPTCGTYLTGANITNGDSHRYHCRRAETLPHGKVSIAANLVLPWVKKHTEGYEVKNRPDQTPERLDLEQQKSRLIDLVQSGVISKDDLLPRIERIDARLSELDEERMAPTVIDWDADTGELNQQLRRLLSGVELDENFRPVRLLFRWNRTGVKGLYSLPPRVVDGGSMEDVIAEYDATRIGRGR